MSSDTIQVDSVSTSSEESSAFEEATENIRNDSEGKFKSLLDRYSTQQKELERLEEQNSEYREKLVKTIRERDLNDELLKNVRDELRKETEDLRRRLRDAEIQLKAVQDKSSAQEAHYNVTIRDITSKYNVSVGNLTKKADQAERDKNEAVVKYAMREAEIMNVKAEIVKKEQDLKQCEQDKNELQKNQTQENMANMEKNVNNLRVELEKIKHEKFDCENKMKMAEKRSEASQTTIAELRQQTDVLRKQLIIGKEEKNHLTEELRQVSTKLETQECRLQTETDSMSKCQSDLEVRLRDLAMDSGRLKEENRLLNERNSGIESENFDLLRKLQDLEDRLQLEEEEHEKTKRERTKMANFEGQVKRSQDDATRAKQAQENAEKDKETAEKESVDCRMQAERMLQITEQLTQRNSQLASDLEQIREKCRTVEQKLIEATGQLERTERKLSEREKDLRESNGANTSEMEALREDLIGKTAKVQELQAKLLEEQNDFAAYKKKEKRALKELKSELSSLRRQAESGSMSGDTGYLGTATADTVASVCSRSRTSSLTSLDRITSGSQEERKLSVERSEEHTVTASMQQAMVDKIVVLQRKLARRTEKIEFLEEHVRQCLDELQKKSKIIQQYALREEASLLLPNDDSIEQVPVLKKGTSYALMGSMFTGTSEKKSLQLVTEINSRLQAVLEDALLKNITLKSSVDSLGNEVSRLSRENRLLSLTQNKSKPNEN